MNSIFIDKLFKDLCIKEKDALKNPFICLHSPDSSGKPYFDYLVVDLTRSEDSQFIARFQDLQLAKDYVIYLMK